MTLLPIFTTFKFLVITIISAFFLYLLYVFGYCFFIKPYIRVRYFLKNGGVGKFTYGPLFFFEMEKNARVYGDSLIPFIKTLDKDPSIKFFIRSIGPQPLVILTDLRLVKQFLQEQHKFDKSWHMKEMQHCFRGSQIFLPWQQWKQTRRLIAPQFHFESLKRSVPMILDSIKQTYNGWIETKNFQQNAIDMFNEVSGEAILRYLFNTSLMPIRTEDGRTIITLINDFVKTFVPANNSLTRVLFGAAFVEKGIVPIHKEFLKTRKEALDLCRRLVEEARKSGLDENNYLYILTETAKKEGSEYDDERIIGELFGLLIAGAGTNATNMGFTIYHLYKHPEVLRKLQEEIDREIKDFDNIDLDLLNKMEYTNAIVKETLRMTPPLPALFFRDVVTDCTFDNITVKKGDLVTVIPQLYHRSERFFSKPNDYIPERWLPNTPFPNDKWKEEPYAYMPFSSGPRNCVGQHLAMIEAKLMLIRFVKTFDFKFPDDYELKTVLTVLYDPLAPLIVTLKPKKETLQV